MLFCSKVDYPVQCGDKCREEYSSGCKSWAFDSASSTCFIDVEGPGDLVEGVEVFEFSGIFTCNIGAIN